MKRILAHAALGGAIALAGGLLHDLSRMHDLGNAVGFAGLVYAAISLSLLVVPLFKKIRTQLDSAADEKSRSKSYEELLRLKKLLDEDIISQEEFNARSRVLKAKVL